jgi:tetratricopeptide (TPR) repeat protein
MVYLTPEPDQLAAQAKLVVEAARWFHGRPNDLAVALGQEPGPVVLLPDWLANLVLDLGRAGLADEAIQVADALSLIDPAQQPDYFGQVTLGLAEAGQWDEALARIDDGIARWPASLELRTLTGEALAAMCDFDGAEVHFEEALERAEDLDDVDSADLIRDRMVEAMMRAHPPSRSKTTGPRRQPRRKPSRSERRKRQ